MDGSNVFWRLYEAPISLRLICYALLIEFNKFRLKKGELQGVDAYQAEELLDLIHKTESLALR
jgi:hypothetical protein